ncbi:putative TetR family transcriptional regulator [Gordonia effusa NBRC 100432]|uniref:Putative TetR family transcriptional regulator n=1 Tax=Gordonia effusa NBRC 100432 TaxID=1077974 RepID=H0QZZ0_9ACTN|nr:TetR/AcrR family transcriptional regulator [Gordonia effusa]GAB18391.1 putative TetR family transcriptional regulator [Gordonia effusa NBRC 100432]
MTDTSAQVSMTTSPPDAGDVRERLLDAMGRCLMERGYRDTTVADVVRTARTSRRSFYQEFDDKQECFVELLNNANTRMIASIATGVDRNAEWRTQVRQAVSAYVAACEEHPETTWSWIRELPALGKSARLVQRASIESFIALMDSLTDTEQMRSAGIEPMSRENALVIWGGIRELAASTLEQGIPLRTIEEPATTACIALVGIHARQ